jgi:hypothetical protein
MPVLRVDLQEGFDNDTAVVRVDGREAWRKAGIKTRPPVGVAESFEVECAANKAHIEVDVPTRKQSGSLEMDVVEHPYLGVSLGPDRLKFERSRELFRYM